MPRPNVSTCGNRNDKGIGFGVTQNNSNDAQYGEFPWMVAVTRTDVDRSHREGQPVYFFQCGGSLIHPRVVLTAAHCVRGKDNLSIRAGDWNTQTDIESYKTQDRTVSEVIVHEQFNNDILANDLALLILESPIDMSTENVGLICLPEPNKNIDGRDCVVSGWANWKDERGRFTEVLQRFGVNMVPRNQCQPALRTLDHREHYIFILHDSLICANRDPEYNFYKNDGSPLVCPTQDNPRVYVQAGIVAAGYPGPTKSSGVFVNVPYFVKWIKDKMHTRNII